jgi:hypothetical protein
MKASNSDVSCAAKSAVQTGFEALVIGLCSPVLGQRQRALEITRVNNIGAEIEL